MRQHDSKKEEVTARRRRRGGPIGEQRQQLNLPDGFEKDPKFEYRWVNDDGGRIHALTEQDDWDFVAHGNDKGTQVSKRVGTKKDGSEQVAYLVKKPKNFVEDDRAEKARQIDEREGVMRNPIGEGAGGMTDSNYVPSSGINIAVGS